MNLEDYILDNVTIKDYYNDYISPLDIRYKRRDFSNSDMALCPFHEDKNPSLGLINDKFRKGIKVFHCFGCGASGNVIRMHQRIQEQYFNVRLTKKEAMLSLCKLYDLDTEGLVLLEETEDTFVKRNLKIKLNMSRYTIREYEQDLQGIKLSNNIDIDERIKRINSANLKILVMQKGLI